jgi:pimeloyl-ACP methyl ester carboxylesterase
MQVIVEDLVVSYEKVGSGPVVVMLHGWADTLRTFDALVQKMQQNYTIVRIDLAGFGGSQPPAKDWSLLDYARYVSAVLQKIAIMPNDITVLIGHSNGGAIAIKAVSEDILRPKKLVLLASAGIRQDTLKKTAYKSIAKLGKLVTLLLPSSQRGKLRRRLYDAAGSDFLIAEHMQGTFKKIVSEDIQAQAEKIKQRTCLIYGELDTATPPLYGQMLQHAISGSVLHVVQNADHFLHQNHTEEVYRYIREFDKV